MLLNGSALKLEVRRDMDFKGNGAAVGQSGMVMEDLCGFSVERDARVCWS